MVTSQKISLYYDQYRDKEVTFTKDILRTLGIDPRQIYVKCNGVQWPCIINSASLMMARIILGTKGGAYAQITKPDSPPTSLRFYFLEQGNQSLSFFVTAHVTNVTAYMGSQELAIVTLTYTQRPPDDLIGKIGELLEANTNAVRRREDRIVINDDSKRKLGLSKVESIIYIQSVPRHCIIRDLSFSGAKIILVGIPQFLEKKETVLCLQFDDLPKPVIIKGHIVHSTRIEGRKDIVFANISFDEKQIPSSYKIHINTYLSSIHKKHLSAAEQLAMQQKQIAEQVQKEAQAAAAAQAANPTAPEAAQTDGQTSVPGQSEQSENATSSSETDFTSAPDPMREQQEPSAPQA